MTLRQTLGIPLVLAYPLLTQAAASTGLAYLAGAAWLCLAALVLVAFPGKWGGAGFAALAGALLLADADTLLKFPPMIINLAFAAWFGKSLAAGEEPVISWFARLARGEELPPDLARFTRRATVVWTAFFVCMAIAAAALALLASREIWSLFANGIDYLLVAVLFVGMHVYRRLRYPHHKHRSLAEVVRIVARSGRLAPRRSASK
ncbi:MAG TPA: hypothetical protein VEF92_05590 [Burkholderiales bacterium]|nr:hypothetical protein [Burkholderiales bacterium]